MHGQQKDEEQHFRDSADSDDHETLLGRSESPYEDSRSRTRSWSTCCYLALSATVLSFLSAYVGAAFGSGWWVNLDQICIERISQPCEWKVDLARFEHYADDEHSAGDKDR